MSEDQSHFKKSSNGGGQKSAMSPGGTVDVLGRASLIGLHLVSGIIVGTMLGYGLDRYFDLFPCCSGCGFFLGLIAGFRMMWLDARAIIKTEEKGERSASPSAKS